MSSLNWSTRKALYEQAAAQLQNGLSTTQVLEEFAKRLLRRGQKDKAAAVVQIGRLVRDGNSFTVAMGDDLSDIERAILAAGEHAGGLPQAMRLILDVRERTGRITSGFRAALFSPAMYLISLWVTLWVIGDSVVPQYAQIVPVDHWTGWAYVMYLMGQIAVGWFGWTLLVLLIGSALFVGLSRKRWTGRGRAFCDEHVFPFTLFRDTEGFTWLMTYVALLRADVKETVALQMQLRSATPWMESRLRPVLAGLRNGLSLPAALRDGGHGFPSLDLIDEIGAYAGFKNFPEKIENVAREYAAAVEKRMLRATYAIGFVVSALTFLAMGVVQLGANSIQSILMSSMGS